MKGALYIFGLKKLILTTKHKNKNIMCNIKSLEKIITIAQETTEEIIPILEKFNNQSDFLQKNSNNVDDRKIDEYSKVCETLKTKVPIFTSQLQNCHEKLNKIPHEKTNHLNTLQGQITAMDEVKKTIPKIFFNPQNITQAAS